MAAEQWIDHLAEVVDAGEHFAQRLTNLPAPPDGVGVSELLTLLARLGAADGDPIRGKAVAQAITRDAQRVEIALSELLHGVSRQIAVMGAGGKDRTVIVTSDFRRGLTVHHLEGYGRVAVGLVRELDGSHWFHSTMSPDELYRLDGGVTGLIPAVVLGPTRDGRPRPWYVTSSVLSLTRSFRQEQVRAAEQAQAHRDAWHRSEAQRVAAAAKPVDVQLAELKREVAELRKQQPAAV